MDFVLRFFAVNRLIIPLKKIKSSIEKEVARDGKSERGKCGGEVREWGRGMTALALITARLTGSDWAFTSPRSGLLRPIGGSLSLSLLTLSLTLAAGV